MTAVSLADSDMPRWGGSGSGSGLRLLGGLAVAGLVAAGLFLLMMSMVSNTDSGIQEQGEQGAVNFIRIDEQPQETRTKERQPPEKPEPPDEPPPPSQPTTSTVAKPQASAPELDVPNIETSANIEGSPYLGGKAEPSASPGQGAGGIDKDPSPVRRVPPTYPATAKRANIEGFVTMEFTVKPDGTVANIKIVNSKPPRMFDRAAKQALSRWRFRPSTSGGQAVSRRARQTIRFSLDSG